MHEGTIGFVIQKSVILIYFMAHFSKLNGTHIPCFKKTHCMRMTVEAFLKAAIFLLWFHGGDAVKFGFGGIKPMEFLKTTKYAPSQFVIWGILWVSLQAESVWQTCSFLDGSQRGRIRGQTATGNGALCRSNRHIVQSWREKHWFLYEMSHETIPEKSFFYSCFCSSGSAQFLR